MGTEVIPKTEEAVPADAPSSLEQQIIRQIEYYFGNFNLSRDKFLREKIKFNDGWMPLETMVKFKRLKKLSVDFDVICGALKKSPKQLMEVNEDSTKIRRRSAAPIIEDYSKRQKDIEQRTLYVDGFKKTNTLDELLEFFKDHKVENIRKYLQKNNKSGSVFATFETREDAEKFLEIKGIKYGSTDLLREWKADYVKRKYGYYNNIRAEKEKKMLKKTQEKAKEEEEDRKNCWNCGRKANETCSGCNVARYCGSFCQHKDWESHHRVCAQSSSNHPSTSSCSTPPRTNSDHSPSPSRASNLVDIKPIKVDTM